ncbi:MAG TPA: hypothetical protein VFS52_22625 [Steroidobacteraceae bacterium]|nr:hypothetical protein [Steroidobacteraceae bacterium]
MNAHCTRWRVPLLEAGVQLFEWRPDAAVRVGVESTALAEVENGWQVTRTPHGDLR